MAISNFFGGGCGRRKRKYLSIEGLLHASSEEQPMVAAGWGQGPA